MIGNEIAIIDLKKESSDNEAGGGTESLFVNQR
jgi:hypothetical protein